MPHTANFRVTAEKLEEHKIMLPETVLSWLLLRRSGMDVVETALIMSQVLQQHEFSRHGGRLGDHVRSRIGGQIL